MNILSAENISKSFSDSKLFDELNFGLSQGDKIALVGINGTGKSTLLKILAGLIPPDSGSVSLRKGISVSYLEQAPIFDDQHTVWTAIFDADNEVLRAIKSYEDCLENAGDKPDEFQAALEQMDALNAWDYEVKVKEILSKLKVGDTSQLVNKLSGGQRKRVALAKLLLSEPDLLILDEPTNHLDLDTVEWLENRLASQNTTLILVTHDRYFLDRVSNQIVELDNGKIFRYQGNYTYFLEQKTERIQQQTVEIDKAKLLMKKELVWMRRMPKARGTKAKYRVENFGNIKEKASQEITDSSIEINFESRRQGKKILEIKELNFSYGDKKMLNDFSYVFKRGERVGIIGQNGAGKSTFLKLLTEELSPQSGTIEKGLNTAYGHYTQETVTFDENKRVVDVIEDIAEIVETKNQTLTASALLTHFQFPPKKQYDQVNKLSGGEKRRLQLLCTLIENPNFLILDEPTNDFDILTLNILEEFLHNFAGCLIIVSHDRYFMDRLVEHLFIFDGTGEVKDFPGNYSDYKNHLAEQLKIAQSQKSSQKPKKVSKKKPQKAKMSYQQRQEFTKIEKEMPKLEEKKETLTEQLNQNTGNYEKIAELSKQIKELTNELEEKEMRWLELSELE